MAFTHRVGVTYASDAGTITNTTDTYTGNGEANYDGTVPGSTVSQAVAIALTMANIKSQVMYSTTALTVVTNSSGSPGATIALAAGKQLVWTIDHLESNPLVTNVTQFLLTNASSSPATVKFRFLTSISAS